MTDMKVGSRLALGFGVVLAIMVALTALAISRMSFIQSHLDQIVEVDAVKLRLVNQMRDLVRYQAVTIRDVVLQEDIAFKKGELKLMKQANATYQVAAAELAKLLDDPAGKRAMDKITAADAKGKAARDEAVEKALSDDSAGAGEVIRQKLRPVQLEHVAALDALLVELEASSKTAAAQATQAYKSALTLMLALGGSALVIGLLTAYLLQRSVVRPLRRAVAVAERVADGDLTQSIESTSSDEVGQLLSALGRMNGSLEGIVVSLKASAEGVAIGSREIASGNMDLSQRTETQASALQETAASMEELSATVKHNADNARQASQLATGASALATRGGEVVGQVVTTMKGINDSAKRIADITAVIDGIAFQTNILALNAAVEAARAGEQGRGFAVVASEVRSLAQRSAEAAKEIKTLIGASMQTVAQGTTLVGQAGSTMTEVVEAIRRVADIAAEISGASAEQSAGVAQVGQAITQMDHATQQNAALVEQSAAAAENLNVQAQHLVQAVAAFKLRDGAVAGDATPAREDLSSPIGATANAEQRRGPNRARNVVRPDFAAGTLPRPSASARGGR